MLAEQFACASELAAAGVGARMACPVCRLHTVFSRHRSAAQLIADGLLLGAWAGDGRMPVPAEVPMLPGTEVTKLLAALGRYLAKGQLLHEMCLNVF